MKVFMCRVAASIFCMIIISSCGGGGSSNNDQSVTYTGKVTQAKITTDNTGIIITNILSDGAFIPPLPALAKAVSSDGKNSSSSVKNISILTRQLSKILPNKIPYSYKKVAKQIGNSVPGSISGTMTYSGTVETDGTGSIDIALSNYNNGDGNYYEGNCTMTVSNYDISYNIATDMNITYSKLTITSASFKTSFSGSIHMISDISNNLENEQYNLCIRNDYSNESIMLENYTISRKYDNWYSPSKCDESTNGRIYLHAHGYVDVVQTSPFIYNHYNQYNLDIPETGGPLLVYGSEGTKLRFSPISIYLFKLEVDTNGDSIFEINSTHSWSQLTGVVFKFEKAIGSDGHEKGHSVAATSDGGFVVAGYSNYNGIDLYLVKTNAIGEIEWQKTFGGSKSELGNSVLETSDKGFIVAGYSYPFGTGGEEVYLVRTDSYGNLLWEKSFGGANIWAYSIKQTADGGFVIAGTLTPYSSGWKDVYLLKISANGDKLWEKTFGTDYEQVAYSIVVTPDGGYAMAGYTFIPSTGKEAIYIIKTDSSGNFVWDKTINKQFHARSFSITNTTKGGLLISGVANNYGYIANIDARGNLLWEKSLDNTTQAVSAIETADGSLIIYALQNSSDMCLIKTDQYGMQQWIKQFNGRSYNYPPAGDSLKIGLDGGYVLTGFNDINWLLQSDIYLIKTDQDGNTR